MKVKELKFMIKLNIRSNIGRIMVYQASEVKLLSTNLYGADNCAVPPSGTISYKKVCLKID